MFRLAHLSDPHLGPMPKARLSELASKRVLGYLNWHMHRGRGMMQAASLEAIIADIHLAAPDHVAVTGDLINIGLPEEFARSRAWLGRVGAPNAVSVIPGNHDAYMRSTLPAALAAWGDYATGDSKPETSRAQFPYLRRRGDIALIGVSSAIATGPFMATGLVDDDQLERLADLLHDTGRDGLCRILLLHHMPIDGATKWKSRLLQADRFRAVISKSGAELILHGHTHRASTHWIGGPQRPVPVIGTQAASLHASLHKRGAGWNLFEISGGPDNWRIAHIERGFAPGASAIQELSRTELNAP